MARYFEGGNLGFTFVWKIENFSFFLQQEDLNLASSTFDVGLEKSDWYLLVSNFRRTDGTTKVYCSLQRSNNGPERITVCCELACLTEDGFPRVLEKTEHIIVRKRSGGLSISMDMEEKTPFDPDDSLIVRCRVWKDKRDFYSPMQCLMHTTVAVERRSFNCIVNHFSSVELNDTRTCSARPMNQQGSTFAMNIFLDGEYVADSKVAIKILNTSAKQNLAVYKISMSDADGNLVAFEQEEHWCALAGTHEILIPEFVSRSLLMENDRLYLPDDALYLKCEFVVCFGERLDNLEQIHYGTPIPSDETWLVKHTGTQTEEKTHASEDNEQLSVSDEKICDISNTLKKDLRCLYKEGSFSDFNLEVGNQMFPVHKSILSARSPVFQTMFNAEMLEKNKNAVCISDLDADTANRMLLYIYTDNTEDLQWESASKLYFAADKYQLLSLKLMCSVYLQTHLSASNVYEVLILSDLHHDENLKTAAQDFLFSQDKTIVDSEEWKSFEQTNLRLAAVTLRQMYLRKPKN